MRGDLVSKTFLFLGFSFSDPNLDYILSRIRILLGNNRREHYCLMRTVQRQDFKKSADFQYARTKQTLQIKDLERYGIMAVLLDSFERYVATLTCLEQTYRTRQVFISGSATTYNPWTEQEAHQFLTLLGRRLAENGMTVITGFGLGVGPHVINGVLEQLEKEGTRNISDHLVLRPFPYAIKDPNRRKERWNSYRREMISQAGIAIFVFGNRKSESGAVVPADGMMEEFRIATEIGLNVVPVGGTGSVAENLHDKIEKEFGAYYPEHVKGLKKAFRDLKKMGRPKEVVERVVKFIEKIK